MYHLAVRLVEPNRTEQFHHISHTLLSHVICNSFIWFDLRKLSRFASLSLSLDLILFAAVFLFVCRVCICVCHVYVYVSVYALLLQCENIMHAVVSSCYYFYPFHNSQFSKWWRWPWRPWWTHLCFQHFTNKHFSAGCVKQWWTRRGKNRTTIHKINDNMNNSAHVCSPWTWTSNTVRVHDDTDCFHFIWIAVLNTQHYSMRLTSSQVEISSNMLYGKISTKTIKSTSAIRSPTVNNTVIRLFISQLFEFASFSTSKCQLASILFIH